MFFTCFSRMLISNVHKSSIIVMNSLDTRFSKNVFEAVQKTRSTCFIGSKTTRLRLVVLNPIKHSCSFFKHYINVTCRKHHLRGVSKSKYCDLLLEIKNWLCNRSWSTIAFSVLLHTRSSRTKKEHTF